MKSLSIAGLTCCVVWLVFFVPPASGQAPAGAGTRGAAAAPATQGKGQLPPNATATALTVDGRQDARLAALEASMDEIHTQLSELRAQVNGRGGSARPPVQLTPEDQYPPRAGKSDDLQQIQNAITNIWSTIDLIKRDIRRVNGQQ